MNYFNIWRFDFLDVKLEICAKKFVKFADYEFAKLPAIVVLNFKVVMISDWEVWAI